MATNTQVDPALEELERRIRLLLPEEYQDCYQELQPVSMGSAGLKYGDDGRVAWNEIWGSFCDLAMAGGPPHRGTLLEPGSQKEIEAQPGRYQQVVDEICRGISMVTRLVAEESHMPGWISVYCKTHAMAGWLARAITIENVSVRFDGHVLSLPAGPSYRNEKETKNVITALAKTCHYWLEHTSSSRQQAIANLFIRMELESPLVQPALPVRDLSAADIKMIEEHLARATAGQICLDESSYKYAGWLGLECSSLNAAIRMMRLTVAENVLARREGTTLFVPIRPESDLSSKRIWQCIEQAHRLQRLD